MLFGADVVIFIHLLNQIVHTFVVNQCGTFSLRLIVPIWYKAGMKLETYLLENDMTPTAFSRQIGVSHVSIVRYMSGDRVPRPEIMNRMFMLTEGAVGPSDFFSLQTRSDPTGAEP